MALEKASITNTVSGDRVAVMFNPEEYTVNRDLNYAQASVPGSSAPLLQFTHGNLQTLDLELLVDTYEAHQDNAAGDDVRTQVKKITDLMAIDPSTHAPPVLLFTWGSFTFVCVLGKATERYIMFRPDGIPVRARVQVSYKEYRNAELDAKEIKRETADYSKLHVVLEGETLSSIAAVAFEDPELWRPIAIHNDIDDPHTLAVGQRLLIPRLPYQDPETGEVLR